MARNAMRFPDMPTLVSQQPDDRPRQPLVSQSMIGGVTGVMPVRASRSANGSMSFSDSVASRFDESSTKSLMSRSTDIRPPVMRDYSPNYTK